MRFKYYLRGLGIGIFGSTMLFIIFSGFHKPTISDEEVKKRASELGMVMESTELFEKTDTESDTEKNTETNTEENTQKNTEQTTEIVTETVVDPILPGDQTVVQTSAVIEVNRGDNCRQVAERLQSAGVIADAEDFRKYLGNAGYGQKLVSGSYEIPMDADYETIAKIITNTP